MPRVEPDVGLELMTLRSRPELKLRVRCLTEPPRHPHIPYEVFCMGNVKTKQTEGQQNSIPYYASFTNEKQMIIILT